MDAWDEFGAAIGDLLTTNLDEPETVEVEEVWSCRECGRQWTALEEAHCVACHRHFSSDSAFDRHQRIDHRPCGKRPENRGDNKHKVCVAISVCRDPAALVTSDGTPRLERVDSPYGPVWARPGNRPAETIPGRTA